LIDATFIYFADYFHAIATIFAMLLSLRRFICRHFAVIFHDALRFFSAYSLHAIMLLFSRFVADAAAAFFFDEYRFSIAAAFVSPLIRLLRFSSIFSFRCRHINVDNNTPHRTETYYDPPDFIADAAPPVSPSPAIAALPLPRC